MKGEIAAMRRILQTSTCFTYNESVESRTFHPFLIRNHFPLGVLFLFRQCKACALFRVQPRVRGLAEPVPRAVVGVGPRAQGQVHDEEPLDGERAVVGVAVLARVRRGGQGPLPLEGRGQAVLTLARSVQCVCVHFWLAAQ